MIYPTRLVEAFPQGINKQHVLVKTINRNIPPVVEVPTIGCHSTADFVCLSMSSPDSETPWDYSNANHYAVTVNGETYNASHENNLFGSNFRVGGRSFWIPFSSENYTYIYIDSNEDQTPVKVTFTPSPNPEHNNIFAVNNYNPQDAEIQYMNKDAPFSICMRPRRGVSCHGATDILIVHIDPSEIGKEYYFGINDSDLGGTWIILEGENLYEFSDENDNINFLHVNINEAGTLELWIESTVVGKEYHIEMNPGSGAILTAESHVIDLEANPTGFIGTTHYGVANIMACVTAQPMTSNATDRVTLSLQKDYHNYLEAVYEIFVDDVSIGVFDLCRLAMNTIPGYDTWTYTDSSGKLTIYFAGTPYPIFKLDFKSQANLVDANIYGIDTWANPTTTYEPVSRNVRVYIKPSRNDV